MAVKVIMYRVRKNKVEYLTGDIIKGLTSGEEYELVKNGYCELVEIDEEDGSDYETDLSKMSANKAKAYISTIDDIETLKELLKKEISTKNRKGIIQVIEDLIDELGEEGDEVDLSKMSLDEAEDHLRTIDDVEILNGFLEKEKAAENREEIVQFIEELIEELSE